MTPFYLFTFVLPAAIIVTVVVSLRMRPPKDVDALFESMEAGQGPGRSERRRSGTLKDEQRWSGKERAGPRLPTDSSPGSPTPH
jgi:hypothetical protein